MGSLEGHLLPGTFILCFGIWWTYALFDRYFKGLVDSVVTKTEYRFQCTATYSRFEGWLKIICSLIGIIAEYYTALDNDLNFSHIGNSQHISMYIFFLINGLIDLLIHFGYPLPNGSDYMSLCLAVTIEALLFSFHLHGRGALDIHVHTLLIIAIIASTVSGLIEWKFRHNMLSALFRSVCALLQGVWFYTIGFILYPPFSSRPTEESFAKLMLLTSLFCYEIAAIILLIIFIGFCFYINNRNILQNREFSSNNHSFNSFSDMDYKNLINESKEEFTQINSKPIDSNIPFKYSTISTSDEEI